MPAQQTADLPEIFRVDLIPLDAEIVALETLRLGLDETIKQMLNEEAEHRVQRDRLTATEPEPKTLDFLFGGDWHAAHAEWERNAVERKEKLEEVTEARERAWGIYRDFFEWVVRPLDGRLKQLRATRAEIFDARMGLCSAAMKAAWRGGMLREAVG